MALVGMGRPRATVSARVLDSDGNVIEDLGVIATPDGVSLPKAAQKLLKEKLVRLKAKREEEEPRKRRFIGIGRKHGS